MSEESASDRIEREYPAKLPDQLQWLEEQMQIERRSILFVMGIFGEEADALEKLPWKKIVKIEDKRYLFEAECAEQILSNYVFRFGYDPKKAGEFAREFVQKVERGQHDLIATIPILAYAKTESEKNIAILSSLRGGENFLFAMAKILGTKSKKPILANGIHRKNVPVPRTTKKIAR